MNDIPLRLDDPTTAAASHDEIQDGLTPNLLDELCQVSGIAGDQAKLQLQLAKVLSRFQSAIFNTAPPKTEPQAREFQSFQKAANRFLKTIDALSKANQESVDSEILYRPPFDSRFFFPEQLDYWAANEKSMKRMRDLVERTAWASTIAAQKTAAHREIHNPTKNTPLDHLIQDLSWVFENGTGQKASRQCYYNASLENYSGHYFDFIVLILGRFAPSSYHSQVALGKRITRVLAKMA